MSAEAASSLDHSLNAKKRGRRQVSQSTVEDKVTKTLKAMGILKCFYNTGQVLETGP